ncbi:hypothetical protein [Pararhizobium sp. DWP3-4]|uniref:hypothetical protein n=1 Tax=Pararhizobium sp. DWP3-4 TaxID=2804565 RepID=UPI003CEFCE35
MMAKDLMMKKIPKSGAPITGRVSPSSATLRQLYMLSGNLCAKPTCNTVLLNANGTIVGEVCHIRAEKPGGARYDATMNEEERRAPANLILLCNVCHKLVDTEHKKYTVNILSRWKSEREEKFEAVGDTLRQRYAEQIEDEAETVDSSSPKSLKGLIKHLDDQNVVHLIDPATYQEITSYCGKLKHLSAPDRSLMRAIVEKSLSLGGRRENDYGISIHPNDLKTIKIDGKRLSEYRINKLAGTLEGHGLGSLDCDSEPALFVSAPDESVA